MYKLLIILLEVVTLILIYNIIYVSISYFRDSGLKKKIETGLNKANVGNLKKNIQYVSKKKHLKYIENLAILIQQSAINVRYKFVTPVFVIFISCITSAVFFTLAQIFIKVFASSVLIAVIGYKIPVVLLNILVSVNSNKITKKLIDLINLIKNFCMVKNDIVFAIASTGEYMQEPLKSVCENFKYETKHGIPPYTALENIKDKIDSTQYSLLIKNLQICSKHSNQYLEVLKKSSKLMMRFAKEQTERRKEINRGVFGILMLVGMSVLICLMLFYMNPGLATALQSSVAGKTIVTMNVFAYLIAVLVVEKLSRFDY